MRSAIFSLLPVREGSTIASVRIGRWLSKSLGIPLHDSSSILDEGALDNLFIVNGSTLYCKCLPDIAKAVSAAGSVVWIQNDYTLPPPKSVSAAESPFRKAFADRGLVPHYWTTCEEHVRATPKSAYVNWNALAYDPDAPQASLDGRTAIYYGAYRQGRTYGFERMLLLAEELGLRISSTSAKFPASVLIPPFRADLLGELAKFGMGIYVQDLKSAPRRHSPATRFYEMLSVGLPMTFLPDCVPTLMQYGFDTSKYILKEGVLGHRHTWAEEQKLWRRDFPAEVGQQVSDAWGKLCHI